MNTHAAQPLLFPANVITHPPHKAQSTPNKAPMTPQRARIASSRLEPKVVIHAPHGTPTFKYMPPPSGQTPQPPAMLTEDEDFKSLLAKRIIRNEQRGVTFRMGEFFGKVRQFET